jgi:hypothetical protein
MKERELEVLKAKLERENDVVRSAQHISVVEQHMAKRGKGEQPVRYPRPRHYRRIWMNRPIDYQAVGEETTDTDLFQITAAQKHELDESAEEQQIGEEPGGPIEDAFEDDFETTGVSQPASPGGPQELLPEENDFDKTGDPPLEDGLEQSGELAKSNEGAPVQPSIDDDFDESGELSPSKDAEVEEIQTKEDAEEPQEQVKSKEGDTETEG